MLHFGLNKSLSVIGSSFVERQALIPFISRSSRNYDRVTVIDDHQLALLLLTLVYTYFPSLSHLFSAGTAQFCSRRLKLNVQLQNCGYRLELVIVSISTEFNACGLRAVKSLTVLDQVSRRRLRLEKNGRVLIMGKM